MTFMVLLDGKKLAEKLLDGVKSEIAAMSKKPRLATVVVGDDPVTSRFIQQKKKIAALIGADFKVYQFPETITTNELRKRISTIVHEKKNMGVIIQLPLQRQINTHYILNSIVPEKDVDVLSAHAIGNFVVGKSRVFPPVAVAIKAFFEEYEIDYKNRFTVIVGAGNLVGKPVTLWLLSEKVTFAVIEKDAKNFRELLAIADIIISGAGSPGLIKGEMIREGVVIIDAATSESAGKVVGDVDFASVAPKASFITPVPGGVGPVVVAMLFRNLVTLVQAKL